MEVGHTTGSKVSNLYDVSNEGMHDMQSNHFLLKHLNIFCDQFGGDIHHLRDKNCFKLIKPFTETPVELTVGHDKNEVKRFLEFRHPRRILLLTSRRFLSGLQRFSKGCTVVHSWGPEESFACEARVSIGCPKGAVILLNIPPDLRSRERCHSVASEDSLPSMRFAGTISQHRSHQIKVWLDTGATACFAGDQLAKRLGLCLTDSSIHSVEVADGKRQSLLGSAKLHVSMGGVGNWPVVVHFLPHFLKGVDLILGQDWMKEYGCILNLESGTCSVKIPDGPSGQMGPRVTLAELPCLNNCPASESSDPLGLLSSCCMTSARVASIYLKRGYQHELMLIKPHLVSESEDITDVRAGPQIGSGVKQVGPGLHTCHSAAQVKGALPVGSIGILPVGGIGMLPVGGIGTLPVGGVGTLSVDSAAALPVGDVGTNPVICQGTTSGVPDGAARLPSEEGGMLVPDQTRIAERGALLEGIQQLASKSEGIPTELMHQLQSLITLHSDIFGESPQAGGAHLDIPEHVIKLKSDARPTFRKNFRMSPLELNELRERVQEFLDKGIITPSNSPFGAPVLFVKKPDGSLRFTLDYRALNQITEKMRYPLPRIDDLLDNVRGAEVFSSLDLASGYFQLRIAKEDSHKTAFCTPFGQYEWRVLPMGLCNAPSTFMQAMNSVFDKPITDEDYRLAGVNPSDLSQKVHRFSDIVLVYLDDLLIRSKTPEDHLAHLKLVFAKLKACNLHIKFSKCHFFQKEIKYLGHILSSEGVRPDPGKIDVLLNWEMPNTVVGMQQFLGLANYFRKFVPNFSRIAAPLYNLTKKSGDSFQSGEEARLAFQTIKKLLINPPILRYPDPDKPYTVISDASITGCGAILVQDDHPVAYYSYRFSGAERNYGTGEQEMLGIIKALMEWRCYLEGCVQLTVVTDHNPLTFFSVQPNLSRRQARWQEKLARFHPFEVVHKPGVTNPADSLSRLYEREAGTQHHESLDNGAGTLHQVRNSVIATLFAVTIAEFQFADDLLVKIRDASKTDEYLSKESNQAKLILEDEGYYTMNGLIVVPKELQREVLRLHHDTPTSGHFGVAKTMDMVGRHFWWPKMRSTVEEYCRTCDSCQRNKSRRCQPYGLLTPLPIPDKPWKVVTMDFIMDLPKTSQGHDALMVIVDKLTKYVILIPCHTSCTAIQAANLFVAHVFQDFGLPVMIISDRDKIFTSDFWKQLMRRLKVEHRYSTAYHPQTDGQTEVMNKVVEEVIRPSLSEDGKNWEEMIPLVQFCINNSRNESTGETPFYLNRGSHPRCPTSVLVPEGKLPVLDAVLVEMQSTLDEVKNRLVAAQHRQKLYADKKRQAHTFTEGQLVLLSTKHLRFKGKVRKFQNKFIGPFPIEKMVGENAARLTLPKVYSRMHPVFHVSLLRRYEIREGAQNSVPLPPPPEILEEDVAYEVEDILAHRPVSVRGRRKGQKHAKTKWEYLIQWKGYDPIHNSWEPEENLSCPDILSAYKARQSSILHGDPEPRAAEIRGAYLSPEVVLEPESNVRLTRAKRKRT